VAFLSMQASVLEVAFGSASYIFESSLRQSMLLTVDDTDDPLS